MKIWEEKAEIQLPEGFEEATGKGKREKHMEWEKSCRIRCT